MNWVPLRSCRRLLKDSPPSPSPPLPSSSGSKISPAVLFVIVILAVIFFVSGLIHLLIRFFIKRRPSPPPPSSPNSNGRSRRGLSGSEALQRQLQSLFHLQDSGLDQSVIDALPIFLYSELVGPKEPFDCAVCLCEFSDDDRLRLLPVCSHAFHLNCIDTWLLSNSTCPLCRGGLFAPGFGVENPVFESDEPGDEDGMPADCEEPQKTSELDVIGTPNSADDEDKMMLPVRLGKFKSLVVDTNDTGDDDHEARVTENAISREEGQSSSSSNSSSNRSTNNLDARRCYSMGSYQYVVGDSILQVALSRNWDGRSGRKRCVDLNSGAEEGLTGKRLLMGSKGESFSVSKIWQWTNKKGRLPLASDRASLEGGLPWIKRGAN